jgi:hypothetical protein
MDPVLDRLASLERQVRTLEHQNNKTLSRLRWWRRLGLGLALLTMFSLPLSLGAAPDERGTGKARDDQQELLKGLLQRFLTVERKLEHVTSETSAEGFPEVIITGANLRIVNGLDTTESTNGLGNLIVGYNEPRFPGFVPRDVEVGDSRTGSHNIVVGQWHNFSSFGGLVVGQGSDISAQYASVSGGLFNTASSYGASISGGARGLTSGDASSISGGFFNTAIGSSSSVSGGERNRTTNGAVAAWVGGGFQNTAFNVAASVGGGTGNTASGVFSSVSGGRNRTAAGDLDWMAGELFQDQ